MIHIMIGSIGFCDSLKGKASSMKYGIFHFMIGISELWCIKMTELVKAMQKFGPDNST